MFILKFQKVFTKFTMPIKKTIMGQLVQLVTCLTADPGVASSIPARSHTFMEFDHEISSTAILLPSADSRRVDISYKRTCTKYWLIAYVTQSHIFDVLDWAAGI